MNRLALDRWNGQNTTLCSVRYAESSKDEGCFAVQVAVCRTFELIMGGLRVASSPNLAITREDLPTPLHF